MPFYVRLIKLTDQGVKDIKNLDKHIATARKILEANGGKLVSAYATLGRYDLVIVVEAPDDKTSAKIASQVASEGILRPESMAAVPLDEFLKSLK